jgi:hypothetical protein
MRPEDMNTINANKKAFNGNIGAVYFAAFVAAASFLVGAAEAIKEIFS